MSDSKLRHVGPSLSGGVARGWEGRKLPARVIANRRPSLYGDQRVKIHHLGNEAAAPVVVAVAKTLLGARAPDGNDHSSDLQLNDVQHAEMRQLGDQLTDDADIQ